MTSRGQCPRGVLVNVFTPPPSRNPVSAPEMDPPFKNPGSAPVGLYDLYSITFTGVHA